MIKPVQFLGESLKCLRAFPPDAKRDVGFQIDKLQRGGRPDDFKPMPAVGPGVEEIRVRGRDGAFRVVYTARIAGAIHVIHAFQKKSQATPAHEIDIAKARYARLIQGLR